MTNHELKQRRVQYRQVYDPHRSRVPFFTPLHGRGGCGAPVGLAAVLKYLTAKVIEMSICNDEELNKLCGCVIIV